MNGQIQLAVGEPMTIYQAPTQKERLLAALDAGPELEVDLSLVSEIDTAGLQLLIVLKREATKVGKQLSFRGHSPAVCEMLEFTRLSGYFGDPMVIPRDAVV